MQVKPDATLKRYFDLYNRSGGLNHGQRIGDDSGGQPSRYRDAGHTQGFTGQISRSPGSILTEDQDLYYLHRKHLFETGEPEFF